MYQEFFWTDLCADLLPPSLTLHHEHVPHICRIDSKKVCMMSVNCMKFDLLAFDNTVADLQEGPGDPVIPPYFG